MRLKILGCSGGIGEERRTTALLIDNDILVDCGTGVGDMSIDKLSAIKHIFLTHTHLDHIACLPLLLDIIQGKKASRAIQLHLTQESLDILVKHIFNWKIWPDFFNMPGKNDPVIQSVVHKCGDLIEIDGRIIEMLPVKHTVPAVGYRVTSEAGKVFAFSGDCTRNTVFWSALNAGAALDLLLVECSYAAHNETLSHLAGHYCSTSLAEDLQLLKHQPELYITHLKSGDEITIQRELEDKISARNLNILQKGDIFEL